MVTTNSQQQQQQPRTFWGKLRRAVRNDPKKAATLTVLVAILVVLQVRLHMSRGDGTARAGAASELVGALTSSYVGTSQNSGGGARSADAGAALRKWMDAPAVP